MKIQKNFNLKEFSCKCGCNSWDDEAKDNIKEVAAKLQKIRDAILIPIYINSGYRCCAHNTKEGGSPNSQHLLGKAADVWTKVISPEKMAKLGEKYGFTGIGVYPAFTHLDTRNYEARW